MASETRDSINDIWGERTPHGPGQAWPVRVDERVSETPERWVRGTCVLCSNGCGLDIGVKDGKIVGVRGLATDVTNKGRLGPKGLHGWVANNSEDRLKRPLIRKGGRLQEASWDEAIDLIVQKSKEIVEKHTSGAIGFYTSGQLFLEEYYTLGVIGKGGLGTPHMDGNTRLCTATAAAALKVSFGADGQPGGYEDLDTTDCVLHVGHNIASQQTVLWMRILDRLAGPNPPKIIVIDPRRTFTAEKATVHLAPKVGTNVAVMNGLLHLIIQAGKTDPAFLEAHTVGYDDLKKTVEKYTPEHVEELSGVPAADLRAAGDILANTETLVSTILQGVYQSMQATAAAVQVNNIHLVRGLIGKPGSGILQMNGQPTAQNTRETGADGDLPGFRNWGNPEHIRQLAQLWNVPFNKIPHWSPPTHAMQIWRYAEQGSIKMLWIQATNPAVSLPQLSRIRGILDKEDLFVVVQDAFLTETAARADVVLPAAIWGEKTGTFTNVSRTVHISCKAVEPPGEARSDLDIFLDYARRMDFRDQDGQPLIKWHDAEGAFEAWKECTRGRPCDYTGLTYQKLLAGSGVPWPVNQAHPDGTVRLYTDFVFPTAADYAETYGHDLETGAAVTSEEYRAHDPNGRAIIKAADYREPHEVPNDEYPLWLTTGRQVYHFHTRTKTGRSKELQDAAPDAFVQLSPEDAAKYGIENDDWILVESRRGLVIERALIGNIEPGLVFIPWHYGYWDDPSRPRAANELTITEWDPVSKQPHYKYAAVRISKYDARDALPKAGWLGRAVEAARNLVAGEKEPSASSSRSEGPQPKTTQRVDG
ncbi:molybdopterin oxidoreductase (plasmid) [Deinococcus aetherius]|uniref:Molybdopterin oxidoreductase n=1 Tax=Deinococcus aetherius TaxID=200252 RepID=A0ABM8AIT4_9DEIO|nr:nitrate reductase [Deinococcus aetherius]BDP43732.1 molybdopterin oxidoreductase [Deinococcus aetherius]